MNGTRRVEARGAALADHRFLAALAILAFNDQWLKWNHPSWVTGKLSDFAGMVVFPVVLASLASILLPGLSKKAHRAVVLSSIFASGLLLASIKLSSRAATAVESVLAAITGTPQQIIVDATDLVGLAALPLAARILGSPKPLKIPNQLRPFLLVAAALACVATSPAYDPPDENWDDVRIEGSVIRVERGRYGHGDEGLADTGGEPWISTDDGMTWTLGPSPGPALEWDDREGILAAYEAREAAVKQRQRTELCLRTQPDTCIRLDGGRILESNNGGVDWETVWKINGAEAWAQAQWDVVRGQDLAVTETGAVIAAMGSVGPLRRSPSGQWTPSVKSLRTFPDGFGQLLMGLAVVVAGLVVFVRNEMRFLGLLTLGFGGLQYVLGFGTIIDDKQPADPMSGLGGFLVFLGVMALISFVGLISVVSRDPRPNRILSVRARDFAPLALGLVAIPIPFALWSQDRFEWNLAILLLCLTTAAVTFLTALLAGDPILPGQLAIGSSSTRANRPPPPTSNSTQVMASGAIKTAKVKSETAMRNFALLGVIAALWPALTYWNALSERSTAMSQVIVMTGFVPAVAFWLQGLVLNRNFLRRRAWTPRVTLAITLGAVGAYLVKRHGPLPVFGPTLGVLEVLGRGILLAGFIAAIYLIGGPTPDPRRDPSYRPKSPGLSLPEREKAGPQR